MINLKIKVKSSVIIFSENIYLELFLSESDKTKFLEIIKKNHQGNYINSLYSEPHDKINYEFSKWEITMKHFRNKSLNMDSYNILKPYYLVRLKDSRKIIGGVEVSLNNLNANIGLFIDKSHSNKGFGTESINCIVNFLKNNSKVKSVIWECYNNNHGSLKLAKKCGFDYIHDKQDDKDRTISTFILKIN